MPIHDWTRVDAGVFHDFHQAWVQEIKRALNRLLPRDYYALSEQRGAGFEPDGLTWRSRGWDDGPDVAPADDDPDADGGVLVAAPRATRVAETDLDYYRRKQTIVAVRHVSGDELVAVVEIVSPGNKSSRHALDEFVKKAAALIDHRIHLLILDLLPPTPRDPAGTHGRIWDEMTGQPYDMPPDKPLTLVSYEAGSALRAFIEPVAVGDRLPDVPLFLRPDRCLMVSLEATYAEAFASVPRRWRDVLEPR
jgi:hypothetical protein